MQTIKASEFKAKCLALMDEVNQTGEEIVVTKNGQPVSKLVPFKQPRSTLFGLHKSEVDMRDDLTEPLDIEWDAT